MIQLRKVDTNYLYPARWGWINYKILDWPGCMIIDNGLFGQISVRTVFKQKLAGTVLE